MTLKDELTRLVGTVLLLEKSGEIAPERMKRLSQSRNNTQLWMCLMVKVKCDAIKTILRQNLECWAHESV